MKKKFSNLLAENLLSLNNPFIMKKCLSLFAFFCIFGSLAAQEFDYHPSYVQENILARRAWGYWQTYLRVENSAFLDTALYYSELGADFARRLARYDEIPVLPNLKQPIPSLRRIQSKLPPQTAMIYFVSGRDAIILQSDAFALVEDFHKESSRLLLDDMRDVFHPPAQHGHLAESEKARFMNAAHRLYLEIKATIEGLAARGVRHLIFCNSPNYFYDLLLCSPGDILLSYGELDYLFMHFTVSYAPSLTLWEREPLPAGKGRILAVAPTYSPVASPELPRSERVENLRLRLQPLRHSQRQAQAIVDSYAGDLLLGRAAKQSAAVENWEKGDYSVVHLATHNVLHQASQDSAMIVFNESAASPTDDLLTRYELSMLELSTPLLLLTGCEGGWINGAGVGETGNGLAYQALYAGVSCVVANRWLVEDSMAAPLLEHFYKGLHKGLLPAEALQKAQLCYLQNAEKAEQHPYYWASYFCVGNGTQPIRLQKWRLNSTIWLLLLQRFLTPIWLRSRKNKRPTDPKRPLKIWEEV